MKKNASDKNSENRDPVSGAPGSHPVGAGLGAAAGAVAGSAAGPIGTAVGIAIGAVVGGLAGKGIAEAVNPSHEDAYWRENHKRQPFAGNRSYEEYEDAYRNGYQGYSKYGTTGRSFEDFEDELREDYERSAQRRLDWSEAREASWAAWRRVSGDFRRLIGYSIEDVHNHSVGTVRNVWLDEFSGQPVLLGVKTGWIFGRNHVVPVSAAQVNHNKQFVRLPFTEEKIKDAPSFDEDSEIQDTEVRDIFSYYGIETQPAVSASQRKEFMEPERQETPKGSLTKEVTEKAKVELHDERLKVGKREVEAGGVRLRKVVRVETANEPVELRREEIVIERVAGDEQLGGATSAEFGEEDIFIPLRREEPVVEKEARLREEVRIGKKTQIDRENISGTVRHEDVEIENQRDRETR